MNEVRTFHCERCGRYHKETDDFDFLGNLFHKIDVNFGYSSPFDDEKLEFSICELCLFDFYREAIHSLSNKKVGTLKKVER